MFSKQGFTYKMFKSERYLRNRWDSPRCVSCSLLLLHQRRRPVVDIRAQMLIFLRSFITPTPVSSDDFVCNECFGLLEKWEQWSNKPNASQEEMPVFGHQNICFGCGISIARKRSSRVSQDCPQRAIILRSTPAHHVTHLKRVCRACWAAATRCTLKEQRKELQDIKPDIRSIIPVDMEINAQSQPAIPEPPPMPEPPLQQEQLPRRPQSKINSLTFKRTASTTRRCLFDGCKNTERHLVPGVLKEMILLQYKIYIPLCARICQYHLLSNQWNELDTPYTDFTGFQVDDIFSKLTKASERQLDFNNLSSMDPNLCHYFLGISASQFNELLKSIPMLSNHVPKPSVALSIFIVKHRTGDTNEKLSALFKIPRSSLERYMNKVKMCLDPHLLPRKLRIDQISSQNK